MRTQSKLSITWVSHKPSLTSHKSI
jgi:hypothetical protein